MKKFLIVSAALFLISCEEETDCKGVPIEDMACILIYEPVCGCDNKTYSNSCFATAAGVEEWSEGNCE